MLILLVAFIGGFALNVTYMQTLKDAAKGRAAWASHWNTLAYFCSVLSTVLLMERCFLAVAAYAIGCWIGTYLAVKRQ